MDNFNYKTMDKMHFCPNPEAIGLRFRHSGNKEIYTVTGFCWNSDTDEWHVLHSRLDSLIQCSRSITNFQGYRQDGTKRFEMVFPELVTDSRIENPKITIC